MVFAALHLKMMIKVIKLSGTETDGERAWSQRGIPCFQLTAVIYISFTPTGEERGAGQQCFTEAL